jgi:hypothetical protein
MRRSADSTGFNRRSTPIAFSSATPWASGDRTILSGLRFFRARRCVGLCERLLRGLSGADGGCLLVVPPQQRKFGSAGQPQQRRVNQRSSRSSRTQPPRTPNAYGSLSVKKHSASFRHGSPARDCELLTVSERFPTLLVPPVSFEMQMHVDPQSCEYPSGQSGGAVVVVFRMQRCVAGSTVYSALGPFSGKARTHADGASTQPPLTVGR